MRKRSFFLTLTTSLLLAGSAGAGDVTYKLDTPGVT